MNIRFLETFIWVAQLRSFKAAAGKLHLTQAAISGALPRSRTTWANCCSSGAAATRG